MGCCFSTENAATKPPPPPHHHLNDNKSNLYSIDRSPPQTCTPPLVEEETVVKEILSETPKSKPIISNFQQIDDLKKPMFLQPNAPQQQVKGTVLKKPRMVFNPDELSEDASEICSSTISECVSTATEKREIHDDGGIDDVRKTRHRSPAKYQNRQVSGDRLVGKSPVRRSEPSPGRVRSGPGRDGSGFVGNGQRRGSAQSPDRRSRSPATRVDGSVSRTGLGRCPSGRRTGKSPGRVGPELNGKIRKVEDGNGNKDSKLAPTSNESLENPLVSLECFIFL